MMLVIAMLCGCMETSGFQDVNNIATIDYSFSDEYSEKHYLFDLDKGVLFAAFGSSERVEDCPELKLEKSEIETIRKLMAPSKTWNGYKDKPLIDLDSRAVYHNYEIVIGYSDGTSWSLSGYSKNGAKWPKGFEQLKSTLDEIVEPKIYGSFTVDKTYSYDGKYYALVTQKEDYSGSSQIEVVIYTSDDKEVSSFKPVQEKFWGICWEKDSYNIWVQSGRQSSTICYSVSGDEWSVNHDAVRPEYLTGRYVVPESGDSGS